MSRMIILMVVILLGGAFHSPVSAAELKTVDSVDLDRYLGTWYEIASYPAWFQKNCTAVKAEYARRDGV